MQNYAFSKRRYKELLVTIDISLKEKKTLVEKLTLNLPASQTLSLLFLLNAQGKNNV